MLDAMLKENGMVLFAILKCSEVEKKETTVEKELRAKQTTYEATHLASELGATSEQPNPWISL